jgi:hypothetical protein
MFQQAGRDCWFHRLINNSMDGWWMWQLEAHLDFVTAAALATRAASSNCEPLSARPSEAAPQSASSSESDSEIKSRRRLRCC